MKSPFPGMDPYLEKHWRDVHASLIIYARDQLQEQLPVSLVARVEERIVFEVGEREHHRYPDVRVIESPRERSGSGGAAVAVAADESEESFIVPIDAEPMTETFIEILDAASGRRVVTVIEFLSLTNKTQGDGLTSYQRKQAELRQGRVSLVEIDLLRAGERVQVLPVRTIKPKKRPAYVGCVRRGWQPGLAEIFPIPLRRALPSIKIPLREQEAEIRLELQPLIDQAYRKGRYADSLDYHEPADPPLEGADADWADELLKAAGKR
jgi:hypothetical protein